MKAFTDLIFTADFFYSILRVSRIVAMSLCEPRSWV